MQFIMFPATLFPHRELGSTAGVLTPDSWFPSIHPSLAPLKLTKEVFSPWVCCNRSQKPWASQQKCLTGFTLDQLDTTAKIEKRQKLWIVTINWLILQGQEEDLALTLYFRHLGFHGGVYQSNYHKSLKSNDNRCNKYSCVPNMSVQKKLPHVPGLPHQGTI